MLYTIRPITWYPYMTNRLRSEWTFLGTFTIYKKGLGKWCVILDPEQPARHTLPQETYWGNSIKECQDWAQERLTVKLHKHLTPVEDDNGIRESELPQSHFSRDEKVPATQL